MVERLTATFGAALDASEQNDPFEYGDDEPFYYVGVGE
jgi:hypothetical protein